MNSFDVGAIPPSTAAIFGCMLVNGDEYVRCTRCSFGGCDVRVEGCGCTLHARCVQLKQDGPLEVCPQCGRATTGLVLFPMSFREIDEARKTVAVLASTGRRNRKRRSGELSGKEEKGSSYVSERRTGRWTSEEMTFCDKLIAKFEVGHLPLMDGIKLNEFLGNMLKSRQSRLTKKMKNAKLSSKTFVHTTRFIADVNEAREFSDVEDSFFHAVQNHQERAEIKFHMQKEWRELFSNLCVSIGQPLDADSWLSSVEEMDRRLSHVKEVARMARRKLMMGFALRTDSKNPDQGVFIEEVDEERLVADQSAAAEILGVGSGTNSDNFLSMLADKSMLESTKCSNDITDLAGNSSLLHSAPFLSKSIAYMQRHNVPFEHVDLWVPSFVSNGGSNVDTSTCRLCYAGSATVDYQLGEDGTCSVPLTGEETFNLSAFGDYSQKFSFDVGCGLPGRVYKSGAPTWEQNVMNAPHQHFERCGGAEQWRIRTVVGVPIASPNVGRIVVILYSHSDREKDQELVARLSEEFTRMLPSPKWKLVVDIGESRPVHVNTECAVTNRNVPAEDEDNSQHSSSVAICVDPCVDQIVSLLGQYMPSDTSSPFGSYIQGFMSLRLLLLRASRTAQEEEIVNTMLGSYSSYSAGGRAKNDIALMLARDYLFLAQQSQQHCNESYINQGHPLGQQTQQISNTGQMLNVTHTSYKPFYSINPSSSSTASYHTSPSLVPIPLLGNTTDAASIVST
mmetsp:Transcript_30774/g.35095  ORF Transcript_30774/g.35095 Transcript_30774/m.35095 type:complete len:735 (-) Transcript_30774:232-2436(-)